MYSIRINFLYPFDTLLEFISGSKRVAISQTTSNVGRRYTLYTVKWRFESLCRSKDEGKHLIGLSYCVLNVQL